MLRVHVVDGRALSQCVIMAMSLPYEGCLFSYCLGSGTECGLAVFILIMIPMKTCGNAV